MKKLIFSLILVIFTGCATTKITGIGADGKYVGPIVKGQNGERMVIPNAGRPGVKTWFNLFKGILRK